MSLILLHLMALTLPGAERKTHISLAYELKHVATMFLVVKRSQYNYLHVTKDAYKISIVNYLKICYQQ